MTSAKPHARPPRSSRRCSRPTPASTSGCAAWDGSEAGPENAPVVVIRSPRALQRILWRPGELGLARAYISGDLDFEGDLTDGLRHVWGALRDTRRPAGSRWPPPPWPRPRRSAQLKILGPPPEPPGCELRVRGRLHSRARDQAVIGDRAEVRIQDYRDPLDDRYDAVASVEMGEHVGAAQYPRFCAALHARLRPGGRLLIQQMSRGARAPGGGPFIESYITPDMDMRPVGDTVRLIENAGFEVIGVEAMRDHYVRTIRAWLENFEQNLPAIKEILSRGAGPRLAAVPGRRRAGLRGGPDGRRPDPRRPGTPGERPARRAVRPSPCCPRRPRCWS